MKKVLLLGALLGSAALAENLGVINVSTASLGKEESIEDIQASIEVLDQKRVESTSATNVAQLLNEAVGIDVKNSGSTSSISIRGFNDSHSLILVDGLRITGKYGSADLTSISLEDIERVEVVKGPMSALYGADALAGVVNIITKKDAKKDRVKLTATVGAADNKDRATSIIKTSGITKGESITHNFSAEIIEKADYRYDKDSVDTDLRDTSQQKLSIGGKKSLDLDTFVYKIDLYNQDDRGKNYANHTTYEKEEKYRVSALYGYTNDEYLIDTNFAYGVTDAKVDRGTGEETTKYTLGEFNSYFRHFTTDETTNILGIGGKKESIEVSMYTEEAKRLNQNILFQNQYNFSNNFSTIVGVRYDDFDDFGSVTTPKISGKYRDGAFSLRGSYGEGFKAPSFTNMYGHFTRSAGPIVYDIKGSKNLKPEESKTYELALGYRTQSQSSSLTVHSSKMKNLIASYDTSYDPATRTKYVSYKNIDEAVINGVELTTKYSPNRSLDVLAAITYLDTEDKETKERLTGSAKYSGKLSVAYSLGKTTYNLTTKRYQEYFGANANRVNENSNYAIHNLKISYKIDNTQEFFAGIDNLQNRDIPYNMSSRGAPNDPGERYFYTGISVEF